MRCSDNATAAVRFDAFVDDVLRGARLGVDAYHIWPQAMKVDVLPPDRSFDFIGEVENLKPSTAHLIALINRSRVSSNARPVRSFHLSGLPPVAVSHKGGGNRDKSSKKVAGHRACAADFVPLAATVVKLCQFLHVDYTCFGYPLPTECTADATKQQVLMNI